MQTNTILQTLKGRVVGFDSHPDTFTSALIEGKTPAAAIVQNVFNKVPMRQLTQWAKKQLTPEDVVVLEASGNSFEVARRLQALGFQAQVLESCHLGRLKDAHANNDSISAVRIGKAYLAGTAKVVWIPDLQTQERRDIMHAHRKSVRHETQMINRLGSYLSDRGVRLDHSLKKQGREALHKQLRGLRQWTPREWSIIDSYLSELEAARTVRAKWESSMAMEVLQDAVLLSMTRLIGIRDIVAFSAGAVIGDIHRFARPKSLVKYVGLNPCFDDSGKEQWSGGVGGHGREDLRTLLIESAQCILRTKCPLGLWGRKLMARKGSLNLAAAAVARKLVVALWYLLMGKWETLRDVDPSLSRKIGKMITKMGAEGLEALGTDRKELRQKIEQTLKTGRLCTLHVPPATPLTQAEANNRSTASPMPTTTATLGRPGGKMSGVLEEYGLK